MYDFKVPVGISSRHVHLSEEHIDILFGEGHKLTPIKDLSQPGQFACEETVTLIGPKGAIEKVRILGPARKATQVELSATDSFKLGVKPPVRDSGDLNGSPGLELVGPAGRLQLREGAIIAARHIHMPPEHAKKYGLKDGDNVIVHVKGFRAGILEKVLVRVSSSYALDMHVDTDEGNAFGLRNGDMVEVIVSNKLQSFAI